MRLLAASLAAVLLATIAGGGCAAPASTTPTDRELASYGVGWYLGTETREGVELDGLNADYALMKRGFADALAGAKPRYDEERIDEVLELVQQEMARKAVARLLEDDEEFRRIHDENLRKSTARLAEFAQQPDVLTLEGGIHYIVLERGSGPTAAGATSIVFDFTASGLEHEFASGEGVERDADDLVPATARVIAHMRVGDRWKVAIPPDLAFGAAGDPPYIGPNEAIFGEIALKEVRR